MSEPLIITTIKQYEALRTQVRRVLRPTRITIEDIADPDVSNWQDIRSAYETAQTDAFQKKFPVLYAKIRRKK